LSKNQKYGGEFVASSEPIRTDKVGIKANIEGYAPGKRRNQERWQGFHFACVCTSTAMQPLSASTVRSHCSTIGPCASAAETRGECSLTGLKSATKAIGRRKTHLGIR
jgi:hypothetical protein